MEIWILNIYVYWIDALNKIVERMKERKIDRLTNRINKWICTKYRLIINRNKMADILNINTAIIVCVQACKVIYQCETRSLNFKTPMIIDER